MTQYLTWMDILETGIAEIDADHRQLVDEFNSLVTLTMVEGCRDDVIRGVELMALHFQEHFRREEEIMRSHRFPRLQEHADEHQYFNLALKNALYESRHPGAPACSHLSLLKRLHVLFVEILVRHDLDYKSHLLHESGTRVFMSVHVA